MQPKENDGRSEFQESPEDLAQANAVEQALADDASSSGDCVASVDERLAEAEREVLRARAELENFRKRLQRDAEQQLKYANVPLVRDLLEVIDNLNRATEAAQQDAGDPDALRNGVKMVTQQLSGVLAKYGCKPIQSIGAEFDPNIHEAIAQMPSDEYPAGVVAQELAVGYLLHDRVVRPSNVVVSAGPGAGE
jgi:molecular chaperone GrpE